VSNVAAQRDRTLSPASSFTAAARASQSASVRLENTTFELYDASASAHARPMPWLEPVTSAT
jgi:hypothetical protein